MKTGTKREIEENQIRIQEKIIKNERRQKRKNK